MRIEMKDKTKLINKVDSTTAEIYMYGVIGSGLDIDANVVVAEIENLRKKGCRNFRFYVNSEGGEVIQGSALFNYLDRTDIEVEWVVDGVAASMMAMLISNPKHKVKAAKYASFMYHRVQGSCYGNSDEVRNLASMIDTFEKSLVDMMASRMKVDAESVKKEFFTDGLDHWMNAEEAMRRGLVDEIITGKNITPSPKELVSSKDVFNFYNKQLINYKQNQKSMITNKAEIGKLLNIAEAEVSDDTVMTAVKNVLKSNSELQNQLKTVKAENASLKNQIGELNNAKVKSLIDKAIADKKFGEDERESYTRLANTDFELAEKMIGKMKGVERIVDRLDSEHESEEEKDWTFDDYHKKGKLENLKKTNKEKYNKLYKTRFGRNPQD
ncbi:MAG: Clp protease ClpP [Bacteroidales bacterium]|nr:Clp protease ClpP [Bacteroidales bacterium]